MANVTKRGDGRWMGRYRGMDGKERTKTYPTRREAMAWATAEELRKGRGEWTDPARGRVTLDTFAAQWFDSLSVKPKTLQGYRSLYDTHVGPRFGSIQLNRIAYTDVKSWLANLHTAPRTAPGRGVAKKTQAAPRPMSPGRTKQAHQVLCSILDLAVEDGRLPRNPAKSVSGSTKGMVPKAPKNRTHRYLTHKQVQAMAEHMGDCRALFLVLAYGGLRWGEASALQVRDLDLLRSRLSVRRTFSDVSGRLEAGTPKNHATRTVPLPAFLRVELEPLIEGKAMTDLLFTTPHGGPWRNANFRSRRFDPAVKAAGLPPIKPHDLRHTAASLAVQSGANVKAIQRALGHASAAMTLDTYADLFDSDLDGVANKLDEAVSGLRADSVRTERAVTTLRPNGPDDSQAV